VSLIKKIKESIVGKPVMDNTYVKPRPMFPSNKNIKHSFVNFSSAYRIALLTYYTNKEEQALIDKYCKKIIQMGYECEVLMFNDNEEKVSGLFLPNFDLEDLDKDSIPQCPKTDRFIIRRFDIFMNLYFKPSPQLLHISKNSNAKCRVSPFLDFFKDYSDVLIPVEDDSNLTSVIETINQTLNLQPYVRKEI